MTTTLRTPSRRVSRVALTIMLAVAVLFSSLVSTPGSQVADAQTATTTQDFVHEANLVHFITGAVEYTRSEALEIAARHDLILSHARAFSGHVAAMKQVNPEMQILVYQKGATAPPDEGTTHPNWWYLRNAQGQKVVSDPWGSYLMNPNNAGWRNTVVTGCLEARQASGYDGCYFDVMGTGALSIMASAPIRPGTNREYTREEWHVHMRELATYVRSNISSDIPLMSNALTAGRRYFDSRYPSYELADAMGRSHAEVWQRVAYTDVNNFRDLTTYRWELEMLDHASQRGNQLLVTTKLWANATNAQVDQWRSLSYGSFLLANDGTHFWGFTANKATPDPEHPLYELDIGVPTAKYSESPAGIFSRPFTKGLVISNGDETTRTVTLPTGTFTDYKGASYSGTVHVQAHTALVLRKAATPPPTLRRCRGAIATIVGTAGDDVLIGTAGRDVFFAGDGNDRVEGRGGDDVICGGNGDDLIFGGDGKDRVFGDAGNDDLRGGAGNDLVIGDAGNDELRGSSGNDDLRGGYGNDLLLGANGNDRLSGTSGFDTCLGGSGTDTANTCDVVKSVP